MAEIFYWFLNMQIIASLCALVILLLRRFRRIPRRLICWLWLIPALRAILPFGAGGAWGSYGLVALLSRIWGRPGRISGLSSKVPVSVSNYIAAAESYDPLTFPRSWQEDLFRWGGYIWLLIAAAFILAFFLIYGMTIKELRDAFPLKDHKGVWVSEKLQGAALYGILRPRILLPAGTEASPHLAYILLHEETHRARGDNLRRVLAFLAAGICWLNPLSWLCLKCFLTDLELACDQQVLSRIGEEKKKEYALALIEQAAPKNLFACAFGGAAIRLRVENILSFKRMGLLAMLAMASFAALLAWFLLTNPTGGVR